MIIWLNMLGSLAFRTGGKVELIMAAEQESVLIFVPENPTSIEREVLIYTKTSSWRAVGEPLSVRERISTSFRETCETVIANIADMLDMEQHEIMIDKL